HQNRSYPARRSPVFNRQIVQLRTGNSLMVCINTHLKAMWMRVLMLMYAYISINIEQILARCARSSLMLTRAVQRPVLLRRTRTA
ncbi:hypothetical protein MWK71_26380, partial [Escherichia coli]|nr:hypothetical protein [Escherichia coli]